MICQPSRIMAYVSKAFAPGFYRSPIYSTVCIADDNKYLCRSGGESSDGRGGHAVMDLTAWNAWGRRSAAGARKGPMLPAVPVGAPSLASKGGWAGSFPPPHSCYPHMQPVYRRSAPPVSRGGAGGSPGGATPPIGRKTGRYPTRTRKDGGRGSGSPLTRAFAGSKPLRDQPLCPPLGILY